ncbi:MAG: hypothetical protein CSB44_07385 [Gammaproteobacteria bacterium]|nr:MAG: hypothetical protein CSB44_07385 [Gammaproteobacteria bacterium]
MLVALLGLTACDDDDDIIIGTGVTGTVSGRTALARNEVQYLDAYGEQGVAAIDANGHFIVRMPEMDGPVLLRVPLENGGYLYGLEYVTAGAMATQNIHSFSDLAVRNWFALEDRNVDEAFANPTTDTLPSDEAFSGIEDEVQQLVQAILEQYGLGDVSLEDTSFSQGDAGLGTFLEQNYVTVTVNVFTINVYDPATGTSNPADSNDLDTDLTSVVPVVAPSTPANPPTAAGGGNVVGRPPVDDTSDPGNAESTAPAASGEWFNIGDNSHQARVMVMLDDDNPAGAGKITSNLTMLDHAADGTLIYGATMAVNGEERNGVWLMPPNQQGTTTELITSGETVPGGRPNGPFGSAHSASIAPNGTAAIGLTLSGAYEDQVALAIMNPETRVLQRGLVPGDILETDSQQYVFETLTKALATDKEIFFSAIDGRIEDRTGIWTLRNGTASLVFPEQGLEDTPLSLTSGCNFWPGTIDQPIDESFLVDDAGALYVIGTETGDNCSSRTAIVRYLDGNYEYVLRSGDPAPFEDDAAYHYAISLGGVLSDGSVIIYSSLRTNGSFDRYYSIWQYRIGGSPGLIALAGETYESPDGGGTIDYMYGFTINDDQWVLKDIGSPRRLLLGQARTSQPYPTLTPGATNLGYVAGEDARAVLTGFNDNYFLSDVFEAGLAGSSVLFTALMEDAVSNEIVESGLWRTSLDSTLVKVADADDTFEKDGVTYNFFPDASFGNSSNEFRVNSLDNGNLLYRAFSYSALHAIYEIRQLR